MSQLWNWSALLVAVAVGGWLGGRQADANCSEKCFEFEAWTDKKSASSEDNEELFKRRGTGTCHFRGTTDTGQDELQGTETTRKYKKIDELDSLTVCTVICYSGTGFGRVTCTGSLTRGIELDIECSDGCQNTE